MRPVALALCYRHAAVAVSGELLEPHRASVLAGAVRWAEEQVTFDLLWSDTFIGRAGCKVNSRNLLKSNRNVDVEKPCNTTGDLHTT